MFWYCFREREMILDLFEMVTGQRIHTRYFQIGGLAEDIPSGFFPESPQVRRVDAARARRLPRRCSNGTQIWLERTKGIGPLSAQNAIALGRPARICAPPASTGICAATRRISTTTRSSSGAGLSERRRVRPLSRSDGRDGGSRRDRPPEPRQARAIKGCRGSPTTARSCTATRRTPHVHGGSHPPFQDRHRGLLRSRRRNVPQRRVAARRSGCYLVSDRKPEAVARALPRTVVRRARGDGDVHRRGAMIADLIAIVGSLDAVMGDTDR